MNNPLFCIETIFQQGSHVYSPRAKCEMLRELGYAGLSLVLYDQRSIDELPLLLKQLDANKLRAVSIFVMLDVSKPEQIDAKWLDTMQLLQGRGTIIDLAFIGSGEYDKPSAARADSRATDLIKRVCDTGSALGLPVSLYPHTNFWMERVEDAIRLMMRINRPDLGITFNLHHWLATDGEHLEHRLDLALPRLFEVTLNGATKHDHRNADIHPLDTGTYDLFPALCLLARKGYAGPMTLQQWAVKGDVYALLKRSMAGYKDLTHRVARSAHWGLG